MSEDNVTISYEDYNRNKEYFIENLADEINDVCIAAIGLPCAGAAMLFIAHEFISNPNTFGLPMNTPHDVFGNVTGFVINVVCSAGGIITAGLLGGMGVGSFIGDTIASVIGPEKFAKSELARPNPEANRPQESKSRSATNTPNP